MKLHVLSDIHHEFLRGHRPGLVPTDCDVIVLAGDIDVGVSGVVWAISQSEALGKPVIYVPGNHEYYGQHYQTMRERIRERAAGTNVHVLDNDTWVHDGVRILGTTLWTDYRADPNTTQDAAMAYMARRLNDHHMIYFEDRLFAPADALRVHQQARTWLAGELAEPFDGKTVVITHHGPSPTCQNPAYPVGPMSTAFYSDCDELLGDPVALWIYGHTHACLDTNVNGSRLVANQGGYPHEDAPGFDPGFVIAV